MTQEQEYNLILALISQGITNPDNLAIMFNTSKEILEPKKQEVGIIPAGTRVKLYEGRGTLLQDVIVDVDQYRIDKAIQDQNAYLNAAKCSNNNKGVVCSPKPKSTTSVKTGGAWMG